MSPNDLVQLLPVAAPFHRLHHQVLRGQERQIFPQGAIYEGEVVGYTPTGEDITVNVCKTKHLTNTRASGSDDALRLIPVTKFSLEGCLEFLAPDELLEVTPENLRIRKRILDHDLRMKATSKKSKG